MKNLAALCLLVSTLAHGADYFEVRDGLKNSQLVFEQTKKGRVVFLGGSITQMKNGWTEYVSLDLQKRFPETEFEFINAGIGSTGSTAGAFRLKRDVFGNGPVDLLFEEAAVNDSSIGHQSVEQIRGMEGIVRHARKLNPKIDIIIMHFVDPGKMAEYNQGITPTVIQNHEKVAEHYKLTSINLALEVTERIKRKEFTWETDFKNLHPSPFGHKLYSSTISRCFDAAWSVKIADQKPVSYSLPGRLDDYCYDSGHLFPPDKVTALNGFKLDPEWKNQVGGKTREGFVSVPMLVGDKPGDGFELEFEGTAVGLVVAAGPDAGIITFAIGDGPWKKKDLFTRFSPKLHIPRFYVLEAELKHGEKHKLSLRITNQKNRKSKGHACRIVNIAVNGALK